MNLDNVIMEQSRNTAGKKIATWELRMPDNTRKTVDILMRRQDGLVFSFLAKLDRDIHGIHADLCASSLEELARMLNTAVEKDVEKNWQKMIKVDAYSYSNERSSPKEPGEHELKVDWRIVYCKGTGKHMMYVYAGEMFPRDLSYSTNPKDVRFIKWTQQREDVLKSLGRAISEAHDKLSKLIHDDAIAASLDGAASGMRLLIPAEGGVK